MIFDFGQDHGCKSLSDVNDGQHTTGAKERDPRTIYRSQDSSVALKVEVFGSDLCWAHIPDTETTTTVVAIPPIETIRGVLGSRSDAFDHDPILGMRP